jgi:hypothetical protein
MTGQCVIANWNDYKFSDRDLLASDDLRVEARTYSANNLAKKDGNQPDFGAITQACYLGTMRALRTYRA